MRTVDAADEAAYLAEARSWETDRVEQLQRSERLAWRVAAAAVATALVAVGAVAMLVPLKTVEPFVVRVDRASGIVDVVAPLKNARPTYEESVSKYFVAKYVRAREGFSRATAEDSYTTVGLMSAPPVQQQYFERFKPQNPASPLNLYGDYATVTIQVQSVSFVTPSVALVRYLREIHRAGDVATSHWTATVGFRYSGAPMREQDRQANPLGFQAIEYRTDAESPSEPSPRAPAALTADGGS